MVTITKNICKKLGSKLYGKNTLYTNTINVIEKNCIIRYKDINTVTNTLNVNSYRGLYSYGLMIFNRELNKGRPTKYNTLEEAKQAHNAKALASYYKSKKQYKKDIDKSLSQISNKKYSYELAKFFNKHYNFNYFVTVTFCQIRFTNKEKIRTQEDYNNAVQQDYIQRQRNYTLSQVQDNLNNYLNRLNYKESKVFNHYVVSYEKCKKGQWHAHIALNITNTSKEYWTTFLSKKWYLGKAKTLKIRKNTSVKDNTANVLHYLIKDINHKSESLICWDTDIDKHSHRIDLKQSA